MAHFNRLKASLWEKRQAHKSDKELRRKKSRRIKNLRISCSKSKGLGFENLFCFSAFQIVPFALTKIFRLNFSELNVWVKEDHVLSSSNRGCTCRSLDLRHRFYRISRKGHYFEKLVESIRCFFQVLVEKLIYSVPKVKKIYCLIRPQKGQSPNDRLQKILEVWFEIANLLKQIF